MASYNNHMHYSSYSHKLTESTIIRLFGWGAAMCRFKKSGNKHSDFWLVNGSSDFSAFPDGSVKGYEGNIPIRLQVGHRGMGEIHIEKNHAHWLRKFRPSVPEFLYYKLSQNGGVYSVNSQKIQIALHTFPNVLLVLKYIHHVDGDHFTVITMFHHNRTPNGELIGLYQGLSCI